MRALLRKIRQLLRDKRFRRIWYRTVSTTAAIVVFITTYALILPAITMESQAACGIPAHQHDDSCYEEVLVCGQEEFEGHHHDDSCYTVTSELVCSLEEHQHSTENGCYDADGNLICELPEHTHSDDCYQEKRELTCGLEESEGHTHDASCYEKQLVCGMEAHIHNTECYKEDSSAVAASTGAAANIDINDNNNGANSGAGTGNENVEVNGESLEAGAAATTGVLPAEIEQENLSDGYAPTLDELNVNTILTKHTGFYYYHPEEGQESPASSADIQDWQKLNKDTKLASTDLVKAYFAYTIPAGALNETNQIARYRLPANLHLTDDQIIAINESENGIAAAYVDPASNTVLAEDDANYHKYLGAEAVEGSRTPDQTLADGAQEYISAVVKAENVYENTLDADGRYITPDGSAADGPGDYLGQDLIFIFTPYTIEKNQITYDTQGNPTAAGQKVTGWFACDFNTDQIDWTEAPVDADLDKTTVEKTAEIVFAPENKDLKTKEISRTLTIVEETAQDADKETESDAEEPAEADSEDSAETGEDANVTTESGTETASDMDSEDEKAATDDSSNEKTANTETVDTDSTKDKADSEKDADADKNTEAVKTPEPEKDTDSEKDAEDDQAYVDGTLTAEGEGYRITMAYTKEANIPEKASLLVSEITSESDPKAYEECLKKAEKQVVGGKKGGKTEVDKSASRFFDIEITVTDEEGKTEKIEPSAPVSVNIQILETPAATEAEQQLRQQSEPAVLHFAEDGVETINTSDGTNNNATTENSPGAAGNSGKGNNSGSNAVQNSSTTEIRFEAESFSVYGVVYTVDFHWNVDGKEFTHKLSGGDTIALSDLLKALNVLNIPEEEADSFYSRLVEDIDEVKFSDEDLIKVTKITETTTIGDLKKALDIHSTHSAELTADELRKMDQQTITAPDWALISLRAFETSETLTVKLKDGSAFTILVTDSQVTSTTQIDETKGYIFYTKDGDDIYVLKTDGTAEKVQESELSVLGNAYKWHIEHIYTELSDSTDYYSIRPVTNHQVSLGINHASGTNLLQGGRNNMTFNTVEGGFTLQGVDDYQLVLKNDKTGFDAIQDTGSVMQIFDQGDVGTYEFTVKTHDYSKGKVVGLDSRGQTPANQAEYESVTSLNKTNRYSITAESQSRKYEFDCWKLNGVERRDLGAVINPGDLTIDGPGYTLEAFFKQKQNLSDDDKTPQEINKEALDQWLSDLQNKQVPLSQDGCDKTAEVYDYENRIYRVDMTAKSSLATFDGNVDIGFILDVSGSMHFPSKLIPDGGIEGLKSVNINQINQNYNGFSNQMDTGLYYFLIADKAGTATVYRLFWRSNYSRREWHGNNLVTVYYAPGWWAVDSSYSDDDGRSFRIETNSTFSNDPAGTYYPLYYAGDLKADNTPHVRLDYLQQSMNGTIGTLNTILNTISVAKGDTANPNPDVKVAWNTFYKSVNQSQKDFYSVKGNMPSFDWDTNGGTSTDYALSDAANFHWEQSNSNKRYAILITDGAPQRNSKAIDSETVKAAAQQLKDKGVTLITVGLSMGDVKRGSVLLYDLADTDEEGEPYFFEAKTGDELQYVLYEIINKIMTKATVVGDVNDTIGEAFYPVDKNTGKPLQEGDLIGLDGNRLTAAELAQNPLKPHGTITYDESKDEYGVRWDDQDITWDGWHGSVFVKAKEDLLGGNAVDTNTGDATIVAERYKTSDEPGAHETELKPTSSTAVNYVLEKDLPTPKVNVNELQFLHNQTDWTVYLGEEVDPKQQLINLYENVRIQEVVTKAEDKDADSLPEKVQYTDRDDENEYNNLYPMAPNTISDRRESEIPGNAEQVEFRAMDLIKKLVEETNSGTTYDWWDYENHKPKYDDFFTAAQRKETVGGKEQVVGIELPYHVYGLDDNGKVCIRLTQETKTGETAEANEGLDPSPHNTQIVGKGVEKYTLTIFYTPDYDVVPYGQGGEVDAETFHTGDFGTGYQGHAAGTETSDNVHNINVYAVPLYVYKIDNENKILPGATFGLYRVAKNGETSVTAAQLKSDFGVTVPGGDYYCISSGISGEDGLARLATVHDGDNSADLLVPGETYYLIETHVPAGYLRDTAVKTVTVQKLDGVYSDLQKQQIPGKEYPFNWDQGAVIVIDGQPAMVVSSDTGIPVQSEGTSGGYSGNASGETTGGNQTSGSGTAGDNDQEQDQTEYTPSTNPADYVYGKDAVAFRTTVENILQYTGLDVTKLWQDQGGTNKAAEGFNITFKLMRKAVAVSDGEEGSGNTDGGASDGDGTSGNSGDGNSGNTDENNSSSAGSEPVVLAAGPDLPAGKDGVVTNASDAGITVNADGTVTLTYTNGQWPTAQIDKLLRYTDEIGSQRWEYEVVETGNKDANETPRIFIKTTYDRSADEETGRETVLIKNIENSDIHIHVKKKWIGNDDQELTEAPEENISFDLYRVVHVDCDHVWTEEVTKEPTCPAIVNDQDEAAVAAAFEAAKGIKTFTCEKCGATRTEEIEPLEHEWGDWSPAITSEYYGQTITQTRTCARNHDHTETRTIKVLCEEEDHQWTEVCTDAEAYPEAGLKPATCEEDGRGYRMCSVCGTVDTSEVITIRRLGHQWDTGTVKPGDEAECETPGKRTYTCTRPGCHYGENNGPATMTEVIPALGHDYQGVVTTPATCTTDGVMTYTCANGDRHNCSHTEGTGEGNHPKGDNDYHPASYTVTIPATGHEWEEVPDSYVAPTQTTDGSITYRCKHKDTCGVEDRVVTIPKLATTYKDKDGNDTGIVTEPVDFPAFSHQNQGDSVDLEPTGIVIIKDHKTNEDAAYVFYNGLHTTIGQVYQDGIYNNCAILTGTILTRDYFLDSNGNVVDKLVYNGDLYKDENGEYYVAYPGAASPTTDNRGSDQNYKPPGMKSENKWYKLPAASPVGGGSAKALYPHVTLPGSTIIPAVTDQVLASLPAEEVKSALRSVRNTVILPAFAEEVAAETEDSAHMTPTRLTRINNLLTTLAGSGGTARTVVSRAILTDPDATPQQKVNVDLVEFVDNYTLTEGTDPNKWKWDSEALPGYDEDGNKYDYYVVETSPATGYITTYQDQDNGIHDTETAQITNKQLLGSLKINKTVTYNGKAPVTAAQKQKLAGDYTFTIYTDEACKHPYQVEGPNDTKVNKTVTITITDNGEPVSEEVTGLKPGDYWIKESEPGNGSAPLVNPVKVTVEAGKTGENAAIASVTNNYSEGPDEITLRVKKTFSGIDRTKIPQNFSITITAGGQTYTLTKPAQGVSGNADNIAFTESDDGLTWNWTIQNVPAGTNFNVAEANENVDGYTVTTSGTGNNIQIQAAALFAEDVAVTTDPASAGGVDVSEGQFAWNVKGTGNENRIFLAKLSDTRVMAVTENALTLSERKAVENLLTSNAAFIGWGSDVSYFSIAKHPDGFQTGNVVAGYEQNNDAIIFSRMNPDADLWAACATAPMKDTAGTADLSVVNTYSNVPINLDIIKEDETNTTKKLGGAEFTIQEIADEAPAQGGTMTPKQGADLRTTHPTNATTGTTEFLSLTQGYYELKEITPPPGYVLGEGITVYFKVSNGRVTWLQKGEGKPSTWEDMPLDNNGTPTGQDKPMVTFKNAVEANEQTSTAASNAAFVVKNTPGAELPHTGGSGPRFIYLLGGALTAFAVLLLGRRKRRE